MAKFSLHNRLDGAEEQKLLLEFCHALVVVKTLEEAANLLIDLCSKQEIQMIAKRLKIAKLLLKGDTYEDIREKIKVSPQTIARVHAWLAESGAGYRLVIERDKDMSIPAFQYPARGSWSQLKRRYPMYFWPQILLEEVVRGANNRQRAKLLTTLKVLKKSGQKHVMLWQLERVLKASL
jgi:TrpR-related protein YerC/YecD